MGAKQKYNRWESMSIKELYSRYAAGTPKAAQNRKLMCPDKLKLFFNKIMKNDKDMGYKKQKVMEQRFLELEKRKNGSNLHK